MFTFIKIRSIVTTSALNYRRHKIAFVDQVKKAKIAAELKKVMPTSWKYSLAVRHHSSIVLTISAAPVDLLGEIKARYDEESWKNSDNPKTVRNHHSVNQFYLDAQFTTSLEIFKAIRAALNTDNFDKSDVMTDYFHVGHYVDIHLGNWDKPFKYLAPMKEAA